MDLAIEISGLRKTFGGKPALNGLTLGVSPGRICGFLGRNGAGKTTAIKILLGMTRANAGWAKVLGLDISHELASIAVRAKTGYVAEHREFYTYMSVAQVIAFTRSFYPSWNRELERRYLDTFQLEPEKKIKHLSKGMRSKLALLLAFSRDPELLILDEPTDGLDPVANEQVLKAIASFASSAGKTVFFSSHQLSEVEQIADSVAIIDCGKTVLSGDLDEMKSSFRNVRIVFRDSVPQRFLEREGIWSVHREANSVSMLVAEELDTLVNDARAAEAKAVDVAPANLKDIFLSVVQEA